jgi:hypothetical protein
MAIGEALGGIVGGILGNNAAKMDRSKQKELMKQMVEEYKKIGYPPDYAKELILQEFTSAGLYTPEIEEDLNESVPESEVANIEEDPALRDAQLQALTAMQQRGRVGLSAEDRAALNQVRQQVQTDSQAKQQQILQEMQARGQGGGGAELAARLSASQAGADRASTASDTIMAQAQERALQALNSSGTMASNMRNQDFGIAEAQAQAVDERNRFLANNSIGRQTRNVAALNTAQQQNLANNQSISNANTTLANTEAQRQATALQQQYQDKLNYAAGITGQQGKLANYYGDTANAKAAAQVAMGKGVGQIADSGYNEAKSMMGSSGGIAGIASMFSDKDLKEDIEYSDDDVQQFLDSLSNRIKRKKM